MLAWKQLRMFLPREKPWAAAGQRGSMAGMRTRTKIALCVGLFAIVVGVAVALRFPTKPAVEIKFVRYTKDGDAVLAFTNLGKATMSVGSSALFREPDQDPEAIQGPIHHYTLAPGLGRQLVTRSTIWPETLRRGGTISMHCLPVRSRLGHELEVLLSRVGIRTASTGVLATVTMPPSATNTPASPLP